VGTGNVLRILFAVSWNTLGWRAAADTQKSVEIQDLQRLVLSWLSWRPLRAAPATWEGLDRSLTSSQMDCANNALSTGTQVSQDDRPRYVPNGGRTMSYAPRPESTYGYNRPGRDSYYASGDSTPYNAAGPSNGYYPNRARYPRTASEPHFNNGIYPGPGNQQSYETVTTASGSGSDPIGYSTDPSSENSSMDRIAPQVPVKEPQETYGFNGFGTTPQFIPQVNGFNGQQSVNGMQRAPNGYADQGPPPPRKLGKQSPNQPMKLGNTNGNTGPPPAQRPDVGEKRKSWFGKRFSKSK
jgi:hypothetical protein